MFKKVVISAIAIVALLSIISIAVFRSIASDYKLHQVTVDYTVVQNTLGGNVGILKTGAGAVIIDTLTFASQGAQLIEIAKDITGEDVVAVINTHYHPDHTHGNPAFADIDNLRIIATNRTDHHLKTKSTVFNTEQAAKTLPNEFIDDSETLRIGRKSLVIMHPGVGHTDGDLVVLIREDRVLQTGDLFFNKRYPVIDLEAGASLPAWFDTLEKLLDMGNSYDTVVPGHGALSDENGLAQFQLFIEQLADVGSNAAKIGSSLVDTQVNAYLNEDKGYENISLGLLTISSRNKVIEAAWREATAELNL